MWRLGKSCGFARLAIGVCAGFLFAGVSANLRGAARPDNPPPDAVGLIEGESIAVTGPMSVETVRGQSKTMLRSGSEVRVKSGTAHIDLVEGGQIFICGPAHLSVLKAGGAITVALDTGTIHVHVENDPAITVYTPLIQAKPISIGGGAEDLLVGFESSATMCIRANRGAIRIEQQLTGQSVLVPQTGDIMLTNGQIESLRNAAGHCSCEIAVTSETPPEVSRLATTEEIRTTPEEAKQKTAEEPESNIATKEEPIYQVIVPPLVYDAKAKVQPEIDPKMIILVRRVRVRPTLIFQGSVAGENAAATPKPAQASSVASAASPAAGKAATPPATDTFVNRARKWWNKIWSPT
jgi:hypothetical protein